MNNFVENDSSAIIARKKLHRKRAKSQLRGISNLQFSKSDTFFQEACNKAEIPVTGRQASKFRNKQGLAYHMRNK